MTTLSLALSGLLACAFFGGTGFYNRPILGLHPDRNSARYIQSLVASGDTGGFWIADDPVEFLNLANTRTPVRRVRGKVPYHRFDVPYPWDATFRIEPLSDAHAIVLQTRRCEVYEMYDTSFSGETLAAYSGAHWSLRRPFVPLHPGTPSAMASGLSLYAGAVRWEEVAAGHVDHALNFAAAAGSVAQWSFVRPASDTDGIPFRGDGRYQLPYGALLRLHASFDTSRFGPQSAAIARAMKRYGIYLADTARTNELYNTAALDGSNHWNAQDLAALETIHITDFDVMPLGVISRVPGH